MAHRDYSAVIVLATWATLMLTANAFGDDIYSCVDKQGNNRIQNVPCSKKEKTINRQRFAEPNQQTAPSSVPAPDAAQAGTDPTRDQQEASDSKRDQEHEADAARQKQAYDTARLQCLQDALDRAYAMAIRTGLLSGPIFAATIQSLSNMCR